MSWTVACFCGTVFEAPPDRCPTCGSQVPDTHSTGRAAWGPQRPKVSSLPDVGARPTGFDSLEQELSELIATAPSQLD